MQKFFYIKETIETRHDAETVIQILNKNIETFHAGKPRITAKFFQGFFDRNNFVISRFIRKKNIFLPIIHGAIENKTSGAIINMEIKPNYYTLGFIAFLLLCIFFILAIPVIKSFFHPVDNTPFLIITGYSILITAITFFGSLIFKIEAKLAINFIKRILE